MTKVIKFYADWCGPCRVYAKAFDKVAEELKEEVEFLNINVESDTSGIAAEYKIKSIPQTVIIKEDNETIIGGRLSEEQLKRAILA